MFKSHVSSPTSSWETVCQIKNGKVFLNQEGHPSIREATALDSETTQFSFRAYTHTTFTYTLQHLYVKRILTKIYKNSDIYIL